jgi:quinol monooxygenase YgiN
MTDVIVTAVFHPVDGGKQALVTALQAGIPAVHEEAGCSLYAIHDAEDGTIVMLEKWDSREDLAAHAAGPAVEQLNALIGEYLASPVVVTTMTAIPAGTLAQGSL